MDHGKQHWAGSQADIQAWDPSLDMKCDLTQAATVPQF